MPPTIDADRLWSSLMELAAIGATTRGGVCRLAGSDEDRRGRDLFVTWCTGAGLEVRVDGMGNLFGRRAGTDRDRPPVMIGSHLDSQPTGGRFDGAYGVMAALEVVRALDDAGVTTVAPVEIVSWTNEEGARFPPAMVSSGVFAGAFTAEWARAQTDPDGVTLGDELDRIGYTGPAPVGRPVGAYVEAHIEQGPILEAEGTTIGVVTGVQGVRWYDVDVPGREGHAGSTPMDRRRDALVAAAGVIATLPELAAAHGPDARATVGVVTAHPASRNTIPGRVTFTADLRHPDTAVLEKMESALRERVAAVGGTVTDVWQSPPVDFDAGVVHAVRRSAAAAGLSHRDIVSGAGHDACYLATVCPTGMIFVPCRDGLSHNEAEFAESEWCAAGARVLLGVTLELAGEASAPEDVG
jgi:beta-ureidopropionase / N-carbamoyl-L-amino-acid hydrolase